MTFPRLDELTSKLKTLQPCPDGTEEAIYKLLIELSVDKLLEEVAAFINAPIEEIPKALDSVMLMRLVGWFVDSGALVPAADRAQGVVKSVTEGDASVSWQSPTWATAKLSETVLINEDFAKLLVKYRRLAGWSTERGARIYGTK